MSLDFFEFRKSERPGVSANLFRPLQMVFPSMLYASIILPFYFCPNRPRVLPALVRSTPRATPSADAAVTVPSTSRRRPALLALSLPPRCASVRSSDFTYDGVLTLFVLLDNWSKKAIRRKTTGTGRMRHLKELPRRFKNGFREGILSFMMVYCDIYYLSVLGTQAKAVQA